MKTYVLGIILTEQLDQVLLILKKRPEWQAGLYNFPGGHIEKDEISIQAVIREIKEECDLAIPVDDWHYLGRIINSGHYYVNIFTAQYSVVGHGIVNQNEDQIVSWFPVNNLPENIISNLKWLIPLAIDHYNGNSPDKLESGQFNYHY